MHLQMALLGAADQFSQRVPLGGGLTALVRGIGQRGHVFAEYPGEHEIEIGVGITIYKRLNLRFALNRIRIEMGEVNPNPTSLWRSGKCIGTTKPSGKPKRQCEHRYHRQTGANTNALWLYEAKGGNGWRCF